MSEAERPDVIVTTDGREVKLRPVSQILMQRAINAVEREHRQQGEPLDPPAYTAEIAGGGTEAHAHDAESIADPKTTDEERAAWQAYVAARARLEAAQNERTTQIALFKGLEIEDPPESWADEQRWLGLDVPEDARERKLAYIETEVLKTPADIMAATFGILRLTMAGIPQEVLDAAEASFRRALSRQAPEPGAGAAGQGSLDVQPAAGGAPGGKSLGPDAAAVGCAAGGGAGRDAGGATGGDEDGGGGG